MYKPNHTVEYLEFYIADADEIVYKSICVIRSKEAIIVIQVQRDLVHHRSLIERAANEKNFLFLHELFINYLEKTLQK